MNDYKVEKVTLIIVNAPDLGPNRARIAIEVYPPLPEDDTDIYENETPALIMADAIMAAIMDSKVYKGALEEDAIKDPEKEATPEVFPFTGMRKLT